MQPHSRTDRREEAPRRALVARFLSDVRGATALEYGLIASLMVLALIAALPVVLAGTNGMYGKISNALVNSSR